MVPSGHLLQKVLVLTFHMPLERSGVAVALVTSGRLALERFLLLVGEKVAVEVVLPLKALVAQEAGVLAFVAVDEPVLGQRRLVCEYFAAFAAVLDSVFLACGHGFE